MVIACLLFHMNWSINCLSSIKKLIGVFTGIESSHKLTLEKVAFFMMLSHLIWFQGMSFYLFKTTFASFKSVLKLS